MQYQDLREFITELEKQKIFKKWSPPFILLFFDKIIGMMNNNNEFNAINRDGLNSMHELRST